VRTARTYAGFTSSDLILAAGETVFYKVTGASLIEAQSKGHYQGGSHGVSIPIGSIGGRPVRYRVGASRGHYVQGAPAPTAIDKGTVYITNRRVIFQGTKQTRECDFAKLIGFEHDDRSGSTTFSVSNRQKPTTVHYGPSLSASFDFRLDLALAHFKGTVGQFVRQLESELAAIEARRPPGAAPTMSQTVRASSAAQAMDAWRKGPGGQAEAAIKHAMQYMRTAFDARKANPAAPDSLEGVLRAYRRVGEAATAAMTAPSMPDATAQALNAERLSSLIQAVTYLEAGMKANDASLIQRGTHQMNEVTRITDELTQRFRDIRG